MTCDDSGNGQNGMIFHTVRTNDSQEPLYVVVADVLAIDLESEAGSESNKRLKNPRAITFQYKCSAAFVAQMVSFFCM